MHPFNCFLDFESTLIYVDEKKGDNSTVYQKHEVNSCSIKYNCIHDKLSKPLKIINNKDSEQVLKQTIETLEEYAKYSYEFIQHNKLNKGLTNEEEKFHINKNKCDECRCEFNNKNKKCIHHDHINGKYILTLCN